MLALGSIGPWEITIVVLVILILFGGKRLPELARGLGKGIREFRGAVSDTSDQLKSSLKDDPPPPPPSPPAEAPGESSSPDTKPGGDTTQPGGGSQ